MTWGSPPAPPALRGQPGGTLLLASMGAPASGEVPGSAFPVPQRHPLASGGPRTRMLPSLPVRGRPVPRLGLSEASVPAPTPPPPAPQEGRFCRSHLARAPGAGLERAGALCERAARLRQEAAGEAGGSPVPRLQGPPASQVPGPPGAGVLRSAAAETGKAPFSSRSGCAAVAPLQCCQEGEWASAPRTPRLAPARCPCTKGGRPRAIWRVPDRTSITSEPPACTARVRVPKRDPAGACAGFQDNRTVHAWGAKITSLFSPPSVRPAGRAIRSMIHSSIRGAGESHNSHPRAWEFTGSRGSSDIWGEKSGGGGLRFQK